MNQWIAPMAVTMLMASPAYAAGAPAPYQVAARFQLGGDGGWDYLTADPAQHLLYLSRASRVWVVNAQTGVLKAEIPDTPGVHGIALAPELSRGYISCGKANLVKVFDLKTNAVTASIPVGQEPDAILYDAATQRVFAFDGHGKTATVIDAKTNAVVGTIAMGGKPEFARADGQGHVYVNIEDRSELLAIDARTLKPIARWPLAPCTEPSGLAIDAAHRRLFPVCHNRTMLAVNADSGKIVAVMPIGSGVDGADFDPAGGMLYSANGEGTLTIVHESDPDHYSLVQTLQTQAGARTVVVDTATHRIYLPTAQRGPAPKPSLDNPHVRPPILPGTFVVLVVDQRQP